MEQESNYLKSEQELKDKQDELYRKTITGLQQKGQSPGHKDLLELMVSEATILTAIHRIKANKGSRTAGSDHKLMKPDILQKDYPKVIRLVKESFRNYRPKPIKRKYIPKSNSKELRPLGIPSIIDRIVQECVRLIIEPILEAQFFQHAYGFRPMRDTSMALTRVTDIVHITGHYWIIEGDISKFFDCVNHPILIKKLWNVGIRDRRVLMIIKTMLKAGIMGELKNNPIGTPQGSIISPLLANVYLHSFDQWVTREWENKKTQYPYAQKCKQFDRLRKTTSLKETYLVRYADDWVLITSSRRNAEKWKYKITKYLKERLKLTLSEEKTLITDIRRRPIKFLSYEIKAINGKAKKEHILVSKPNQQRLKEKVSEIHKTIKKIKGATKKNDLIHWINLINSKIRGLIQYYECTTKVNVYLRKYVDKLHYAAYLKLRKHGGYKLPAKLVDNLRSVHGKYNTKIPVIEYNGLKIGITRLDFCTWQKSKNKSPKETPYTELGRQMYMKRTGNKPLKVRADDLLSLNWSKIIKIGHKGKLYNFEYFMNRAYAFNRDKGKCRVCKEVLHGDNIHIHHINLSLPLDEVNRVPNLASMHEHCYQMIHSTKDYSMVGKKIWEKVLGFREKLNLI
ncbi:Retron-type reverse transcriptase [Schinkia azotoformans MEV2011]|uniref:Retron-type reverse transcriptase n=1 Tax=Schinkia azotoformans MEV2011 TaxID=1348973 RepID=A0A072NPM5_SCHAZ|nr:group II intron reverse transcriptase/maturase [Schinkia azotoformans]KEF39441.1 Retron-type reverse transcriptase [Schinkia azotoformans MEV2011]MEC1696825.1 group II intron reverse transcriptase/maturase [Schinkia azotoformans]MEC1726642.1 group II intron reverse transcriptase/maturase [Schinkia azotoformans]